MRESERRRLAAPDARTGRRAVVRTGADLTPAFRAMRKSAEQLVGTAGQALDQAIVSRIDFVWVASGASRAELGLLRRDDERHDAARF